MRRPRAELWPAERKTREPFVLTPELARAHASPILAIDKRAIGRAFALADEPPAPPAMTPATNGGAVAVVTIQGPLTQRATMNMCGFSDGYDAIENRVCDALENEDVGAVVLAIDSPGGDAAGLFEAIDRMLAVKARAGKPVYAYADECIASAAYALACIADRIFMPTSGEIGSVGCLAIHCDETARNEKEGLKYTIFRSGPRKAEGNPIEPLTDAASQQLQARVDTLADQFIRFVAARRNMNPEQVKALGGAMFFGPAARSSGLIDGIGSLDTTLTAAIAARAGDTAMTDEEKQKMADLEARLAKLEAPPPPPSSDDGDDHDDGDSDEADGYEDEDEAEDDMEDEDEDEASDDPPVPPKPSPKPPAPKEKRKMKAKAANARLRAENAKLKSELAKKEIADLVRQATRDGKVQPGKKEATIKLGEKIGKDALEAYIEALPTHAVKSESTPGATKTTAVILTADDKKVAKMLGISEEDFAKSKAEDASKKVSA
jgi:signal peptide peptidase SppA